jgi:hypothetical protein
MFAILECKRTRMLKQLECQQTVLDRHPSNGNRSFLVTLICSELHVHVFIR